MVQKLGEGMGSCSAAEDMRSDRTQRSQVSIHYTSVDDMGGLGCHVHGACRRERGAVQELGKGKGSNVDNVSRTSWPGS